MKKWDEILILRNFGHRLKEKLSLRNRGSKHPRSKLSEKDIDKIFELHREGKNSIEIAKIYSMDSSSITLILKGLTWKHCNKSNVEGRLNNKSGCVGVYHQHKGDKWVAEIIRNGKYKRLGSFTKKEDAIRARKKAENEGGVLSVTN